MSVYDLLIDVAIASILILAGQLLRAKIPVFQKLPLSESMDLRWGRRRGQVKR